MHPARQRLFNRIISGGIFAILVALMLSPFFESGKKNDTDYNRVIIEYTLSKDFYSAQGRSFVDAEGLEHFLKSAKEGRNGAGTLPSATTYEPANLVDPADSN